MPRFCWKVLAFTGTAMLMTLLLYLTLPRDALADLFYFAVLPTIAVLSLIIFIPRRR